MRIVRRFSYIWECVGYGKPSKSFVGEWQRIGGCNSSNVFEVERQGLLNLFDGLFVGFKLTSYVQLLTF